MVRCNVAIHLGNKVRVSIIAAVCLLALVAMLKNVLAVPAQVLTRDLIIYIVVYSCFAFLCPDKSQGMQPTLTERPLFWTILIVLVTLGILALYMV